jgi:hypothetical protein
MKTTSCCLFKIFSFVLLFTITGHYVVNAQNVGVNYTGAVPNASALLDIDPTSGDMKGLLIPRMTLTERGTIANPATGLLIYQNKQYTGFLL